MARILILTHEFPPFRGGIAAVSHGLASGAAAIGHEPIVLAPDYYKPAAELSDSGEYDVMRFPGATCPIVSARRLTRFTALCRRTIARVEPDVVHAADPPAQMALTALARFRLVGRYYFTVHGTEVLRYKEELFPRTWMWHAFKRVSGVAAVSSAVLNMTVRELGLSRARALVAHPAIAAIWHEAPLANRADTRRKWGAADADVVLLTIARVVHEKGHDDVVAALARLPDALRQRVLYVIIGTGPREFGDALAAAAASANVRLLRLGETSDRAAVAAADASDVFVMPSKRTATRLEGFGIAYVEAGARGLPSLARATGGAVEAVRAGETGIVLPEAAGRDELAAELRQLIENAQLRHRLGSAARRFASDFTWQRHADQVYNAFT